MIEANGATLIHGDCRAVLKTLDAESVHCCVTSIPYWGLRSYGTEPQVWGGDSNCGHEWAHQERGRRKDILPSEVSSAGRLGTHEHCTGQNDGGRFCVCCDAWRGELGLEPTPDLFVQHVVEVFQAVWRVLRKDATLWLNIGDCYACSPNGRKAEAIENDDRTFRDKPFSTVTRPSYRRDDAEVAVGQRRSAPTLKPKDLVGVPWRVAFALQADGWWLRSDIIWAKPNPMPSSVRDRPTGSHEYLFLLAKADRYFYDADAIREPNTPDMQRRAALGHTRGANGKLDASREDHQSFRGERHKEITTNGRNKRTVWEIATQPLPDQHFAAFPEALVAPCILAGTSEAGVCAACAAPWQRVKEVVGKQKAQNGPNTAKKIESVQGRHGSTSSLYTAFTPIHQTTGWAPTCRCGVTETVPCVVLDPFAGSGTTGRVATRLGRRSILIDLKPEYLAIARKRTAQRGLML